MNPATLDEYDLFFRSGLPDPYPFYYRLRRDDPIHFNSKYNSWLFLRYDDVSHILKHGPDTTSKRLPAYFVCAPESVRAQSKSLLDLITQEMLLKDPPDHTRLRGLVNKAFTPQMLENWRPRVRQIATELVDHICDSGEMDAVRDFANPLPMRVICDMLGLPAADQRRFKDWSTDIAALDAMTEDFAAVAARAQQSVGELKEYFRHMVALRSKDPKDDLITALAAAEEQGDRLSEDELFAMYVLLLFAGHETTTGLIGNGLLALLRHPDQLELVTKDPSLIPSAVEEMLRYDGSIQRMTRMAARDFQMDGRTIREGQWLWAMIGSANRDPAHFPDPDRFDITREKQRHIAFGVGIHFCLGAALARMEAQIAFDVLLRRLPRMRLATDHVAWRESVSLRAPQSLPVAFD